MLKSVQELLKNTFSFTILGNYEVGSTLLKITHLAHRKSYLVIVVPNSHERSPKFDIMSSWTVFKHCS